MGDTLRAMTDYDKAIQLDRFEPEGYIRRGRLLAARGDMDAALSDLNRAIQLDSTNTLAYFNRAILNAESDRVREAMADLDKVLQYEPGNALTLYNRSLLSAQLGDFESALADMDRVISINPSNVLAYFNRAGFFVSMERWDDALADYNKAIELFPDFAKAYMNRSWVELQMGMRRASREDYLTAQRKVAEYHASSVEGAEFADTTRRFNALLALDADFARHGFNNEMLQYRDVDINLKPLYKFILTDTRDATNYALRHRYENPLLEQFLDNMPVPVAIVPVGTASEAPDSLVLPVNLSPGMRSFLQALADVEAHHYTAALEHYDRASSASVADDTYARFYRGFYLMNRAVLRAEMIDFIASFESNVQTLTMDDRGSVRARVREQVSRQYDYSQAVEDMEAAAEALPGIPYIHFNLANLYCLSSRLVEAIDEYEKAIRLYPWMGEAYFNRGLVLIYLKDKEKGCIDLSRAGELGVGDAYSVISRYCDEDSGL